MLWLRCSVILLCATISVSGFALLSLGVWVLYGVSTFVVVLEPYSAQLTNISYICIGLGAILFLSGLTGCCGAWNENRCLIMLFCVIMTMLFLVQIVSTVFIMAYRELVGLMVRQAFKTSLKEFYMGPGATDPVSIAWNTVMIKFKCCGFENSTADFRNSVFSSTTGQLYPRTCCVNKIQPECDGVSVVPHLIQPKSCFGTVIAAIQEQSAMLGATGGGICILELAAMCLAMTLFVKLSVMQYSHSEGRAP
ncbi:tetraspanin-16-like [Chanos chanos]|uniref:Tetraspanin n=1 Tax=Chanos chanos TaxID=29144 RepID=A0A6J2WRM4_CHACN|nr:tetraspanin-16-like [Chanos chanos]